MQRLAEVRFTVNSSKGCKDKTANKKTKSIMYYQPLTHEVELQEMKKNEKNTNKEPLFPKNLTNMIPQICQIAQ